MGDPVVVATVRRPHGLEGGLLVHPETDDPEGVFLPGRIFGVREAPEGCPERLTLESAGPGPKGWRLRFREIGQRELAKRCVGCALELDGDLLADLEEDEFFLHDLVGLEVRDVSGGLVGTVDWVFDRPGQAVLVVVGEREGRSAERLIPFTAEIVRGVDLDAGVVRIDSPPGLLDI